MTEEDSKKLQQSINDGVEPPQELAQRLFPSLYAGFDFKVLEDSRIPTIEYQGKRREAGRCLKAGWIHRVVEGLDVGKSRLREGVGWQCVLPPLAISIDMTLKSLRILPGHPVSAHTVTAPQWPPPSVPHIW